MLFSGRLGVGERVLKGQVQRGVLRFQTFPCSHCCSGLKGKRLVGDPPKQSVVLGGR